MVSKVLIDQGNSINTMYWKTVQRLEVSSDTIHPYAGLPLVSPPSSIKSPVHATHSE
ncbi:hypothetical protein JHK86_033604 [Glycine max]|nr:hypothetical protein JHK86_033604 [Glycine max]